MCVPKSMHVHHVCVQATENRVQDLCKDRRCYSPLSRLSSPKKACLSMVAYYGYYGL